MARASTTATRPKSRRAREAQRAIRLVASVAVLGIALGLVMQVLIILARLLAAGPVPSVAVLADLAQTVTWATLVCSGVAIGVSIGKARAAVGGLLGAIFAPLALAAAKSVQKIVLSLLDAVAQPAAISLEIMGVVRALEYGSLAFLLAVLSQREVRRLWAYLGAGGAVAMLFGGGVVAATIWRRVAIANAPAPFELAGLMVNELLTPVGCALVIYVGQLVAVNFRLYSRGITPTGTAS